MINVSELQMLTYSEDSVNASLTGPGASLLHTDRGFTGEREMLEQNES